MSSILYFAVFFIILFFGRVSAFGGGNIPGGWNDVDVSEPRVVDAGRFAIEQQFHGRKVEYKIVQAKQQVRRMSNILKWKIA